MNKRFVVGVILLLLVFFFIEYRMPASFVWEPTYAPDDQQPFGCELFDSVLSASLPHGYTVTQNTLWQLEHDSAFKSKPHGVIILSSESDGGRTNLDALFAMVRRGCVVLVSAGGDALSLEDTIDLSVFYNNSFSLRSFSKITPQLDTLVWVGPLSGNQPTDSLQVTVKDDMLEWVVEVGDSLSYMPLIERFAVSIPIGQGEIIVLSTPLLMTNYGMLNANERLLIGRLLSRMSHLPVVRTTAYVQHTAFTEESPFYVFLQRPPLRWALYLTVLTILVFMFFTARRRQRVIPVIEPPKNGNLDFVRLVGTLFYRQGDHRGLVERKLNHVAEMIRRQTGVVILEERIAPDQLSLLSRLTGLDAETLRIRIANAREATTGHHVVTPEEMKSHVDNLNEIVNALK